MSKNFTHRNHHIPQRYQLGFADAQKRVHIYDRKQKAYVYGKPKNIGFQNDFYTTVAQSGEPSDAVEKLLADVEGRSWALINRLASKQDLSEVERSTVSFFAALMRTRTTAFDRFSERVTDVMAKSLFHLLLPDEKAVQDRHQEATDKTLTDDEAKQILDALEQDAFDVVPPRQNTIKSMLEIATQLERALTGMEWTFAPPQTSVNS